VILRLVLSTALVACAACENCPDRLVGLTAIPAALDRNVTVPVRVEFATDVFVERPPARERDIRITLSGPVEAGTPRVAAWNGSLATQESTAIQSVAVLDERAMTFSLRIDPVNTAGTYRLAVIADLAGACAGPNGSADLLVR